MKKNKNTQVQENQPIIVFKNFVKKFKNSQVGPITFEIQKGKFVGLLGSSGSGKTVVLNTIMGATKKFNGEVNIAGYSRKKRNSYKVNEMIGVYQQMDFSLETTTCYQYLKNYCIYSGIKKDLQKETIKFWLEYFKLWEHKDKYVRDFSWGMKNRINLMLCFLKNPEILILDEPGANLDSIWRGKINELLRQLKSLHKTLILSSHNIDEIIDLIDYYIVLSNGKKIFEGDKKDLNVYNKYKIFLHEDFDVNDFRKYCDEKSIKTFKYNPKEWSIVFSTNTLVEINWVFLYFIKNATPISNLVKLHINMESIHKALEGVVGADEIE